MKIGILVSNIGNFGTKGFYNMQEIGLAKALCKFSNEVIVYKLIKGKQQIDFCEKITDYEIKVKNVPCYNIGTHGLVNLNVLGSERIELLIHFSDIQLMVKPLSIWCKKNNIKYINYVGVIKSNSDKWIVRSITNIISKININAYKKSLVFAKTPSIKKQLKEKGVENVEILPVGLDIDLLKRDFELYSREKLKRTLGFDEADKILLFIGRLVDEKKPIDALIILKELIRNGFKYKMILVGTGKLKQDVLNYINRNELNDYVKYIEKIENDDIWSLYHISNWFINLNSNEIFGMSILEAMYYKCTVIAKSAPGPDYIINKGINGIIVSENHIEEFVNSIINNESSRVLMSEAAHNEICSKFLWDNSAKKILDKLA